MHTTKHNLYIIIPLYNEEKNLDRLFLSFLEITRQFGLDYILTIILVNDGCTDDTNNKTTQLIQKYKLNIVILNHKNNMGPGRSFATAFEYIAKILNDNDWVVTMEGDNTSRLELLKQMLKRTNEGYDVVLASPYMYMGGIIHTTTLRVILSDIANVVVKRFFGITGILTVSSFFRLYHGKVLKTLQQIYGDQIIDHSGFECMLELLIKLINNHITISEVPMVLDTSLRIGKSKMKILRTIFGYFSLFIDSKQYKIVNNYRKQLHP